MTDIKNMDGDDWKMRHFTVKLGDTYWRIGLNKATTKAEMMEIPTPKKGLESIPTKIPDHRVIWPEAYDSKGVHYLYHYLDFCSSG